MHNLSIFPSNTGQMLKPIWEFVAFFFTYFLRMNCYKLNKHFPKSSYQLVKMKSVAMSTQKNCGNWYDESVEITISFIFHDPLSHSQWPYIVISISIKRYCCGQACDIPVCVCMRITLRWNDTCDNTHTRIFWPKIEYTICNACMSVTADFVLCLMRCITKTQFVRSSATTSLSQKVFQRNHHCAVVFRNTARFRSQHAIKSRVRWNQFICSKLNLNSSLCLYRRLKRVKYQYLRSTNR